MGLPDPTPELLLAAYSRGIFPMANAGSGEIHWYSPDPRAVIPLDALHVSRSLARTIRADRFEILTDRAFETVMRECAAPGPERDETWIDERLIRAYTGLHAMGSAHSVEAYAGGRLVGGLYGVQIRAGFFGESMFSRPEWGGTDASKVCMVHLVARLRHAGFSLLDTQFSTPHLTRFGCVEIPRAEYLERLVEALRGEARWSPELDLDGAQALELSQA